MTSLKQDAVIAAVIADIVKRNFENSLDENLVKDWQSLIDKIGEHFEPGDVFSEEALGQWALDRSLPPRERGLKLLPSEY
jgi:hypothetical protein